MAFQRIDDPDNHRLVTKLQTFANWWAPKWFPPLTDSDRLPHLPPALEWAVRFGPDFFFGELIAQATETGELQCFHSYGEQYDGFLSDRSDNPIIRFETDDHSFTPTLLNNFVVGTVLNLLVAIAVDEASFDNDQFQDLCQDENLIWDAPYAVGRVRAWLHRDELVVESSFGTAAIRRVP